MAMVGWLLARVNVLLPVRAYTHYLRQRGPLLSAGIGFRMFFSITGLLATGFSIAGLVLSEHPALLDQIIKSVAAAAPGLLQVDGSEGLVDPYQLLNPTSLGWAAGIAAVVTVFTSLGWISGIRDGVRGMMRLGPLVMNPILQILKDVGTLLLMGVALVVSSAASLIFGTAAGWVAEQLGLDPVVAGPLTTSITILVPLLLGWGTALIMYRVAAGLKPARRSLLEGTTLAAVGATVLQIFSTQLLASAGKNPILAPFAIIIGLLIWFNLVSQVYVICAAWVAIREEDLKTEPAVATTGWGARRVQPGKTPVEPPVTRPPEATVRRVQASRYWSAHAEIIFAARAAWPLPVRRWSLPSSETKLRGWRAVWKMVLAFSIPTVLSVGECSTMSGLCSCRMQSVRSAFSRSSTKCRRISTRLPPRSTSALPSLRIRSSAASKTWATCLGEKGAPTVATAFSSGICRAADSTAAPPNEWPTSNDTRRSESRMNSAALTVSATLWLKDPSDHIPADSPSPTLSNRSMPTPLSARALHIRDADGLSLPRVKPWENTPQPFTGPSGRSTTPERSSPVEPWKETFSERDTVSPFV